MDTAARGPKPGEQAPTDRQRDLIFVFLCPSHNLLAEKERERHESFSIFDRRIRFENSTSREIGYDPSAGSPTETLLRLLLPLKDQVRTSFSLAVNQGQDQGIAPHHPAPDEPVRRPH